MKGRLLAIICVPAAIALLSACGGAGTRSGQTGAGAGVNAATTQPGSPPAGREQEGRGLRAAILRGLARDFQSGTGAGPPSFSPCLRRGLKERLTVGELQALVAIYRRPDGQPLAAQALSRLAVPVGDECGGRQYVPEPIAASKAIQGWRLRSKVARRLDLTYGPYIGLACRRPGSSRCDRIGIDLVVGHDAVAVSVAIGGRQLRLHTPGQHNGVAGRDWVGFLAGVKLHLPGSSLPHARDARHRAHWAGFPPVYLPLGIAVSFAGGERRSGHLERVLLSPGWG